MTLHTVTGKILICKACSVSSDMGHTLECYQHTTLPERGYSLNMRTKRWERPETDYPSGNWIGGGFDTPERGYDETMEDYGIGDQ